ncbi:MAG: general secretion pathway protein GspE [Planctomycetaceae bacterium]|nr:general secretion pathway protein GspE [Planctomycetaceae bacterium]
MDVYKEWLGIPDGPRPPDHYELLRCVRFTDEPDRIRANYKKLNAHVRKYATGQYSDQSQALLNELAKAMLCLTDPERKREYDESLGREFEVQRDEFGRLPFLDVLVKQGHVSRDQKKDVEDYSRKTGLSERDAVVQLKLAGPEQAAQALALQLGFSYVELDDMLPEDAILDAVPKNLVKKHTFLPLFIDDGRLLVACVDQPEHELEEELQLRYGVPIRPVITTPRAINQAIAKYYAPGARNEAAEIVPDKKSKDKKSKTASNGKQASGAKQAARGPNQPFSQLPPEEQEKRKQVGYILLCWSVILGMLPQILMMTGVTPAAPLLGLGWFACAAIAAVLGGGVFAWLKLSYWK